MNRGGRVESSQENVPEITFSRIFAFSSHATSPVWSQRWILLLQNQISLFTNTLLQSLCSLTFQNVAYTHACF